MRAYNTRISVRRTDDSWVELGWAESVPIDYVPQAAPDTTTLYVSTRGQLSFGWTGRFTPYFMSLVYYDNHSRRAMRWRKMRRIINRLEGR